MPPLRDRPAGGLRGEQPPTKRLKHTADTSGRVKVGETVYRIDHRSIDAAQDLNEELQAVLDIDNWRSNADGVIDMSDYRARYATAVDLMGDDETTALRGWTHIDDAVDDVPYPDGGTDEFEACDINFDLNEALRGQRRLDDLLRKVYSDLYVGLATLPKAPGPRATLLRVADVPAHYADLFNPGDIVTNAPTFMSASSSNFYAVSSVREGAAAHGSVASKPDSLLAFYLIKSHSARPMIPGLTTRADDEREWVFLPDSVFKIESVTSARSEHIDEKPRVIIVLDEIPREQILGHGVSYAEIKNLYSGAPARVYPHPDCECVSAGVRAFGDSERSVAVGEGVTLRIRDISGQTSVAVGVSPEAMDTILRVWHWKGRPAMENVELYRNSVIDASRSLPEGQQRALEEWTRHFEAYPLRADVTSKVNDLEKYLTTLELGEQPPDDAIALRDSTDAALRALPSPPRPAVLLRVAEAELDERGFSIYGTKVQAGDLVCSGLYMNGFPSGEALLRRHGEILDATSDGDDMALVLMEINSPSARPLLPSESGESSWLIPRGRVFRVENISVGEPMKPRIPGQVVGRGEPGKRSRIAIRLTEVNENEMPAIAKDLTKGHPVSLWQEEVHSRSPVPERRDADMALADRHKDLMEQAQNPSMMRHWLDRYAIDESVRSFSDEYFDLLIRGSDSDGGEHVVERAFLGSLLREAYLESATFRRLFNCAHDTFLRTPPSRWLLKVGDYATTVPRLGEMVLFVGLNPKDAAVYTSARGNVRFDATRSTLHEVVHALTVLPDDEQGHPRGPVVEYTNIILKEMGRDLPARSHYQLQGHDG